MTQKNSMTTTLSRILEDGYQLSENYFQMEINKATAIETIPTVLQLNHYCQS